MKYTISKLTFPNDIEIFQYSLEIHLLKALKRKRIAGRKIGRKTALVIVRALYYAANRAKAAAKRKGLSARERKQLLGVSKVYRKAGEKASKIYKKLYKR